MIDEVRKKLETAMPGSTVTVRDIGAGHETHPHEGAHLRVEVAWSGFEGKAVLDRHRMVYAVLDDEMKARKIHALSMDTRVE